jgi:hypothetical protein
MQYTPHSFSSGVRSSCRAGQRRWIRDKNHVTTLSPYLLKANYGSVSAVEFMPTEIIVFKVKYLSSINFRRVQLRLHLIGLAQEAIKTQTRMECLASRRFKMAHEQVVINNEALCINLSAKLRWRGNYSRKIFRCDAFRVTGVRLQFAPDITEIHYSMFVWDALFLIKYGGVWTCSESGTRGNLRKYLRD